MTFYPLLVPDLLHSFHRNFKQSQVHAVADDRSQVFEALGHGEISLALTYEMDLPPHIAFKPLPAVAAYH